MTYYGSMIILIPAIIFTMYAQAKVNSNFRRYSHDGSGGGEKNA